MNKKEVCERFGFNEITFSKNFKRCQKVILNKYGIYLEKIGRGETAEYVISGNNEPTVLKNPSIEFIQNARQEIIMDKREVHNLIDWDFMVFIGIITCPFMSFRGTYKQFLDYVGIKNKTQDNIKRLKESFKKLQRENYIYYIIDDSVEEEEEYFALFIKRKAELEMKIGIDMIQKCMQLQKKNNMNSWVPLLKTWLGLQLLESGVKNYNKNTDVIFTLAELENTTGVNKKMLIKCKRILESEGIINIKIAYDEERISGQMPIRVGQCINTTDIWERSNVQ